MLHKLLHIIRSANVHSLKQLAQQLDVSQTLLESMIDELVRMGYLRPIQAGCDESCSSCPMSSSCGIGSSGRMWVLTEAGQRMVQATAD